MIQTVTLLWFLSLAMGEDSPITCLFSEECVLPCKSSYHDIIHWQKMNGSHRVDVHSFYKGADQWTHQNEAYSGRTSMFSDQIPTGNASLLLRGVRIQDEGRYKCYTASSTTNKEAFVTLNVEAPIKSVDIKITDDGINCNTTDVYPQPRISWNISGQVNEHVQRDIKGLFSLTSTLKVQGSLINPTYICFISLRGKTQSYTASLKQAITEAYSGESVAIHCPPEDYGTFNLSLTFEDSSTVLSYNSQVPQPYPSGLWRGANVSVTQETTIILQGVDSEKHTGTYSCERVTTQSKRLVQTTVRLKQGQHDLLRNHAGLRAGVIAIICVCVVVPLVVIVAYVCVKKKRQRDKQMTKDSQEKKINIPLTTHITQD